MAVVDLVVVVAGVVVTVTVEVDDVVDPSDVTVVVVVDGATSQ